MIRCFEITFSFHAVDCGVDLVSGIGLDSIKRPGTIVPDDAIVGISVIVAGLHFEQMSALVLGRFREVKVRQSLILERPVECKHVLTPDSSIVRTDEFGVQ